MINFPMGILNAELNCGCCKASGSSGDRSALNIRLGRAVTLSGEIKNTLGKKSDETTEGSVLHLTTRRPAREEEEEEEEVTWPNPDICVCGRSGLARSLLGFCRLICL